MNDYVRRSRANRISGHSQGQIATAIADSVATTSQMS
jgi:hypothetical protein